MTDESMRYTGPKVKRARRLGMAFTAKDAKVMQRRAFAPGQHGQNRARLSEYGRNCAKSRKPRWHTASWNGSLRFIFIKP